MANKGASMAVKIIIRRSIPKEAKQDVYPLLMELREHAKNRDGYVSGETLRNYDNPEDFLVISTWRSVDDWKMWESSPTRKELQNQIDVLVNNQTEYGIYYYA